MSNTHNTLLTNVLRLAVWLLLGGMVFWIWKNQSRQPEIAPAVQAAKQATLPALATEMPATRPDSTKSLAEMPLAQADTAATSQTDTLASADTSPAPMLPTSANRIAENYRTLARVTYQFPKFNLDNRPDGDPVLEAEKMLWRERLPEALARIDSLRASSPDFEAATRIRAHVFFRQGKIAEAGRLFSNLKAAGKPPFSADENDWYLLLCRLAAAGSNAQPFEQLATEMRLRDDAVFREKVKSLLEKVTVLRAEGKL